MKRFTITLSLLLLLVFVVSVPTQTQAPTPPPEMKALEPYIGVWTIEGGIKETPMGPAGKISGKISIQWILNGFFQEFTGENKSELGKIKWIEIHWYDTTAKSYKYQTYDNNGAIGTGSFTLKENGRDWSGIINDNGIQYKHRGEYKFEADMTRITIKSKISTDGKTWMTNFEQIATKVKSTPKTQS